MRPLFLLCMLLLVILLAMVKHADAIRYQVAMQLPKVHHCNNEASPALKSLLQQFHQLGLAGGQLSILSVNGPAQHCAFGWQLQGLRLKQVHPDDSFRYASLSKVLTALTTFSLIEQDKIALDTNLLNLLALPGPFLDEQMSFITVQHLLSHRAGFDRLLAGDPMMQSEPWCPLDIDTLQNIALDFPPGKKMVYSNLGYCLLGQGIANLTQQPLKTLIRGTLRLAQYPSIQTIEAGRFHSQEVEYFFEPPDSKTALLQLNSHAMLASGGWGGTTSDLSQLIQQHLPNLYQAELTFSSHKYLQTSEVTEWRRYHGLVFYKHVVSDKTIHYWRDGSLPGVTALTMITTQGDVLVLLANYRPYDWLPFNDRLGHIVSDFLNQSITEHPTIQVNF
ncbi:serine hydrolase domain-containing protein [Alkalimonas amylolytica]|uniref:D-alanyl-D-alanine carboxypeptidase n=1 Tax=Alkalimonas amylolytica TaxID=152573 RepID=A0A1H4E6D1_ALKAM|nr:serine hydrolase domain-containing protein [Alkalimonas amylolytica]SEA80615.1 D-alanyl-D-alanine carboxypeptidase [Alkalimonas amylolytica]